MGVTMINILALLALILPAIAVMWIEDKENKRQEVNHNQCLKIFLIDQQTSQSQILRSFPM
jgi:hypothetical protein